MANTTIKLKVEDENIVFTSSPPVFSGDVNTISAAFEFGANWDGLTKYAVFYRTIDKPYKVELTDDECLVPHEVMQTSGRMYIGVYGTADGKQKTSEVVFYDLGTGVLAGGMESGDTLALWQEILKKIDDIETISANIDAHVQQAVDAANTATAKATEASGYASTASQKATEATTSESNALQYKTDAETAKTQAESAKAGAESARDQAGTKVQEAIDEMTDEITAQINDALSPRIVESASGESVTVDDASGARLAGLKLYGKSVQDGTPDPTNPVPIESVESPTVTISGKNIIPLIDVARPSLYGVTITKNDDGTISLRGTATALTNVNISPLFNMTAGTYVLSSFLTGFDTDQIRLDLRSGGIGVSDSNVNGQPFTITEDKKVTVNLRVNTGVNCNGVIIKPVLVKGEEAGEFEPITMQTLATALNLHAVPVSSGGNYTDESGQQWLSDVADFESGRITRYTGTATIDESTTFNSKTFTVSTSVLGRFGYKLQNVKANSTVLSNRFLSIDGADVTIVGYANANNNNNNNDGKNSILFILSNDIDTLEELKNFCTENPIDFIYQLHTPTTEDIPAEVMQAYKNLHTNSPVTNVFTDTDAGIELNYIADTKMYIDKRIDAISTTLLNSVTGE